MKMNQLFRYVEEPTHLHTIRLFRVVIYGWVILNTLFLLPAAPHFWSPAALISLTDFASLNSLEKSLNLLHSPSLAHLWPAFIVAQILFALVAMTSRAPMLSSILVFFLTTNLDNKSASIMDGGNNLIHLFLFYLIFMSPNVGGYLRNGLSNVFLLIARVQVVIVYLVAGLGKITGELWPKGVALYYTMNVHEYSHPMMGQFLSDFPFFAVVGAYSTLLFQLSFPWLVWFRKTRGLYLAAGTFFHLGIVFGMGLVSFGFAMCASYFVFYPNERSKKIIEFFKKNSLLTVGFDENCKVCQTVATFVKKYAPHVVVDGAHHPKSTKLSELDLAHRLEAIQSVDEQNIRYSGYWTAVEIVKRLPFGYLVAPVAWLAGVLRIGPKVYSMIAQSSMRESCAKGVCEI